MRRAHDLFNKRYGHSVSAPSPLSMLDPRSRKKDVSESEDEDSDDIFDEEGEEMSEEQRRAEAAEAKEVKVGLLLSEIFLNRYDVDPLLRRGLKDGGLDPVNAMPALVTLI